VGNIAYQLILRRFTKKADLRKIIAFFSRNIYLPERKIKELMSDQPRVICELTSEKEGEILQSSLDDLGCITAIEPKVMDEESCISMRKRSYASLRKEMSKALRGRTSLGLFWIHVTGDDAEPPMPSMMGAFLSSFSAYFRESDTLISIDENQFFLLGFATDRKGTVLVQNKINQAFRELLAIPYKVQIGSAIFPEEARTIPQLFKQAKPVPCSDEAPEQIDISAGRKMQNSCCPVRDRDRERLGTIQLYFTRARGRFLKRLLGLDAKALWHGLSSLSKKQQIDFLYRLPHDYKLAPTLEKIIDSNPKVVSDKRLEKHLEEVILSMSLEEDLEERKKNAAAVAAKLKDVESLPVLPGIAAKLFNILADPYSMMSALAKVIETDPALTLRILKIVNSAFYGFARKIDTVKEAVVILGTDEIKNLAFGISAAKTFQNIHFEGMTNPNALWRHSIGTALIAEYLGRKVPECKGKGVFTAGLLHDAGKIFLIEHFPTLYNEVYATAIKYKVAVVEAEEEKFDLNHAMIGKIVANRWNLPPHLSNAISFHHHPMAASDSAALASITGFSDFLDHRVAALSEPDGEVFFPPYLTYGQLTVLKRLSRDVRFDDFDAITQEVKTLLDENQDLFMIS
jgi:HD-like signal output (HDOD) protein